MRCGQYLPAGCGARRLYVETEMEDVPVNNLIVSALDPQFASIAGTAFTLAGDIVVKGNGFCADKAALEIGMDGTGRLWRAGPGSHLSMRAPPWGLR